MFIHPERLTYLLRQYAADNCTRSELLELLEMIKEAKEDEALRLALENIWQDTTGESGLPPIDKERLFHQIISAGRVRTLPLKRPLRWAVAAASIVILLAAGGIYLYSRVSAPVSVAVHKGVNVFKNDIAPGNNKAILTLANGARIVLDSAKNGSLGLQGHTQIIKLSNGQLAYKADAAGNMQAAPLNYNTISVPRGGQYRIVLPDGTRVWLNSASTLRFPTAFTGGERRVELTGEGYFEVQTDRNRPFRVTLDNMQVQVLGTHFNVMAYKEEGAPRTTLLEGSVRVTGAGPASVTLVPGERVECGEDGNMQVDKDVDTEETTAWKDDFFAFHNTDTRTVMRELARWYDIDVVYDGSPVKAHFYAKIRRNTNLSTVLRALTLTGGLHFAVEGRKVTVSP